jgi:hypothetical protein
MENPTRLVRHLSTETLRGAYAISMELSDRAPSDTEHYLIFSSSQTEEDTIFLKELRELSVEGFQFP